MPRSKERQLQSAVDSSRRTGLRRAVRQAYNLSHRRLLRIHHEKPKRTKEMRQRIVESLRSSSSSTNRLIHAPATYCDGHSSCSCEAMSRLVRWTFGRRRETRVWVAWYLAALCAITSRVHDGRLIGMIGIPYSARLFTINTSSQP